MVSLANSTKHLKKNYASPSQTLSKNRRGGDSPKLDQHYPDSKVIEDTTREENKKLQKIPISLMDTDTKILNKILANWFNGTLKKSYTIYMYSPFTFNRQ